MLLLALMFCYYTFDTVRLLVFGKTVTGVVTEAERKVNGYDSNGEPDQTCYLHYRAEAGETTVTGQAWVYEHTLDRHPEESAIAVTYLRWNPKINRYGGRLKLLWDLVSDLAGILICSYLTVLAISGVFAGVTRAKYPSPPKRRPR
jgi:hypothetical protein